MIKIERIHAVLYDLNGDGILCWKIQMGRRGKKDTVAGCNHIVRFENRWTIQVDGYKILRSRLVFALYNNRWPASGLYIDHIDKNTANDCIINLREVTHQQNMETRTPFRRMREAYAARNSN